MTRLRLPALFSLGLALILVLGHMPRALWWPLSYLSTFLHELGHSLAAVFTGGELVGFQVQPSGAGFAITRGGIRSLVISGGPLGSALAGSALLVANAYPRLRGRLLLVLGVAFAGLALAYGRTPFTLGWGLVVAAVFLALGRTEWPLVQYQLVTVLAVAIGYRGLSGNLQLVWTSLGLARFRPPRGSGIRHSDAEAMAELTGIPAVFWALVWGVLATAMLVLAARFMARRG